MILNFQRVFSNTVKNELNLEDFDSTWPMGNWYFHTDTYIQCHQQNIKG